MSDPDKILCMDLLERLRAEEGDSVEIFCDNPDFDGPNNAISVNGAWTCWTDRRVEGESLLDCLSKAWEIRQRTYGDGK